MALNVFVLIKYRWIFEFCHYFILFFSIWDASQEKTDRNWRPVSYKLMLVTILNSTNDFFILVLRVFNFSLIFGYHNCIFHEFNLSPCRIITILTSAIKEWHCRENPKRWEKAHLDMLNVLLNSLCFFSWDTVTSQKFLSFFCFAYVFLSFRFCTPYAR